MADNKEIIITSEELLEILKKEGVSLSLPSQFKYLEEHPEIIVEGVNDPETMDSIDDEEEEMEEETATITTNSALEVEFSTAKEYVKKAVADWYSYGIGTSLSVAGNRMTVKATASTDEAKVSLASLLSFYLIVGDLADENVKGFKRADALALQNKTFMKEFDSQQELNSYLLDIVSQTFTDSGLGVDQSKIVYTNRLDDNGINVIGMTIYACDELIDKLYAKANRKDFMDATGRIVRKGAGLVGTVAKAATGEVAKETFEGGVRTVAATGTNVVNMLVAGWEGAKEEVNNNLRIGRIKNQPSHVAAKGKAKAEIKEATADTVEAAKSAWKKLTTKRRGRQRNRV